MTTVLEFYHLISNVLLQLYTFYYDQNLFHLTALVLYIIYQDIITKSAHLFFVHTPPSINQEGPELMGSVSTSMFVYWFSCVLGFHEG